MDDYPVPEPRWTDVVVGRFLRFAAGGWVPARWFEPGLPDAAVRAARTGALSLEIVSHCWQYPHLLVYQLSSLVKFPPRNVTATMTVYYSGEDRRTADLLAWFGRIDVPGLHWNWRDLPKEALFRRAIGRNDAALGTGADWIWFTDCDLMFREGCLDGLGNALQGRRDALVYPRIEKCTSLLPENHPMLIVDPADPQIRDIDTSEFFEQTRTRATGPLQITHGDVARACGYCNSLKYYQQPAATWQKAREDRAFRWLLRTQGTPLDIPGVYRIRHVAKGRYAGGKLRSRVRTMIRRVESRLKGR